MPKTKQKNTIYAYRTKQGALKVIIWLVAIFICILIAIFVFLTPY